MSKNINKVKIYEHSSIKYALKKINSNGLKCAFVVSEDNKLLGSLSDGDIRKSLLNNFRLDDPIAKIYNKKPIKIYLNSVPDPKILIILSKKEIGIVPLINDQGRLVSYLKFHELKIYLKKISFPIVIMAGGKGNRLEPFTHVLPKPLIPINGKPVIKIILDFFIKQNKNNFFVTINYKSELLKTYLNDLSNVLNLELIKEKKSLGTAGALRLLPNFNQKFLVVTNCDIIVNFNLDNFINFHKKNKYDLSILAVKKTHEVPYGVLSKNGKMLKKIDEKPLINYEINGGFYILNKELIKLIPDNDKFDFTELISKCLKLNYKVGVYSILEKQWSDIGQWNEYRSTVSKLKI